MMKFITEEYLRDLYRKEPFNIYKLQEGQRFTPGATQYLSDKKIKLNDDVSKEKINVSQKTKVEKKKQEGNSNSMLKQKLCCKLRTVEAMFLVNSSEILKEDIISAQNITNLGREISNIRNVVNGKGTLETVYWEESSEMNSLDFPTEYKDYFEITEFHMQLKNSNVILKMHTLRCTLQELQFEIIETYKNDDDLKNRIINKVNVVINSLSQMICSAVGGKECQMKK